MAIDTQELRRKVNSTDAVDHIDLHANIKPFLSEILDRLEAAEQTVQDYLRIDGEKSQIARRLEAAEKARDAAELMSLALRTKIEKMGQQETVYLFRRKGLDDFCTCSKERYEELSARPRLFEVKKLYTLPGAQAQPAPSVPREAIDKMLTQLMDIAVSNGANSISMPDEYVEVAAWLCGLPAQPAPSAPSEEAAAEMGANGGHVVEAERLAFEAWMRGHCWELNAKWTGTEYRSAFEKGGMVDVHAMRTRELWAAWRDRAALAAPKPEAKP